MRGAWLAGALLLAGCGADAPPAPPGTRPLDAPAPVASVTGELGLGVAGRL